MLRIWKPIGWCAALAVVLSWSGIASAKGVNPFANQDISCGVFAEKLERAYGIPHDLLQAISLAETGRWDPAKGVIFAWPWTVTARGDSTYFDTKAEAMEETKRLLSAGVQNIDVGCMQVNLYYHPNAFGSLTEAFDPAHNIAYAAHFLTELKNQTGSWVQAASNYHSSDPLRNQTYRHRVLKLWEKVRGAPLGDANDLVEDINPDDDAKRAVLHTEALQTRFRARLAAERNMKGRDKREKELDAWRLARGNPELLAQQAVKRQAERERQQRVVLQHTPADFAAKRRSQLAEWRKKNAELHDALAGRAAKVAGNAKDVGVKEAAADGVAAGGAAADRAVGALTDKATNTAAGIENALPESHP